MNRIHIDCYQGKWRLLRDEQVVAEFDNSYDCEAAYLKAKIPPEWAFTDSLKGVLFYSQ